MLLVRYRELSIPQNAPPHSETSIKFDEEEYLNIRHKEIGLNNSNRIGLALSGGGIRAACFSLGILHWLEDSKKIQHIDYVSTVSGGGYAATGFLYGHPPRDPSNETLSRSNIVLHRLLTSEGYLEAGVIPALLMLAAFLISAFFSLSPILLAEQAMYVVSMKPDANWHTALYIFLSATALFIALTLRSKKRKNEDTLLWTSMSVITITMGLQTFLAAKNLINSRLTSGIIFIAFVASAILLTQLPRHKGIRKIQTYTKIALLPLSFLAIVIAGPTGFSAPALYFGFALAIAASLQPILKILDPNFLNFQSRFYSESLRKAFSGTVNIAPITRIKTEKSAPLHIVNLFLHTSESKNPDTRERGGCNFFVTRLHCGSNETGVYSSHSWHMLDGTAPHLDIWRLAAVSGAAVDGHGVRQSPLVNALLSLGNIGLGQWIINPSSKFRLRRGAPNLILNLIAALGVRVGKGIWTRLSDGGHFENLGIYELVRRRCSEIIVVDAGHDPHFKFVDLARASALCHNDFQAEIEIPTLKKGDPETPHRSVYTGSVTYSDGTIAKLIYIKLAISRSHPMRLRLRTSLDKQFPHEPTWNQQVNRDFINSYFQAGFGAAQEALTTDLTPPNTPFVS